MFNKYIFLLVLLILGACSNTAEKELSSEQLQAQLFEKAMVAMEDKNYLVAIDLLTELRINYPFGKYIDHAKLELMSAYFAVSNYVNAILIADSFIRLNPDHEQIDYAWYIKGRAQFEMDRIFAVKYFGGDLAQRDIGQARNALVTFSKLVQGFPASRYKPEAERYIIYLFDTLARHEIQVGKFYFSRGDFLAAAGRGRYVVENFQQSSSVADGLTLMARSYTELGLTELATGAQKVLDKNYPNYDFSID